MSGVWYYDKMVGRYEGMKIAGEEDDVRKQG
jgi:hypothetical protein